MFQSRREAGIFVALSGAAVLSGCAAPAQVSDATLERRIESAVSAQDHEALAQEYERQAQRESSSAKRHVGFAEIYRRNRSEKSSPQAHEPLARHCEELARTYQKAAAEKMEMARLHRELAGRAAGR